jgi:GT2 family glycosyltransferase
MPPPLVSIVIPVYNRYEYTRVCLETVARLTYANRETLVVDNGSSDGTEENIKAEFPWAMVIRSTTNLGYAGGCNLGIRRSSGKHVLLLNNDTRIVSPELLNVLVGILETNPRVGAAGPRLVEYDDPDKIVFDGPTDAVGGMDITGAVLLLRREALRQVGLFDESFFAYYEDRDLFARLKKAGWSLQHSRLVRVAHQGSLTAVLGSPSWYYWHNRNFLVFFRRHGTLRLLLRIFPSWWAGATWFVHQTLRTHDWQKLREWLRGYRDGFRPALANQEKTGPPLEP